VGQEAQQHAALFFGSSLGAKVGEAEQPANRRVTVHRQQRSAFQTQAAFLVIAELQQRQDRQWRTRICGQLRITELCQLIENLVTHQIAIEQLTRLAVPQQDLSFRVADQGGDRQIFQTIGNKTPGIARAAHGLLERHDLSLQTISAEKLGAAAFRKNLRFAVQTCQLPTEVRQHTVQTPPVPDQITKQHAERRRGRRPPVTHFREPGTGQQHTGDPGQRQPQRQTRAPQQKPKHTRHQSDREQCTPARRVIVQVDLRAIRQQRSQRQQH
jgi:hypothetical protein